MSPLSPTPRLASSPPSPSLPAPPQLIVSPSVLLSVATVAGLEVVNRREEQGTLESSEARILPAYAGLWKG